MTVDAVSVSYGDGCYYCALGSNFSMTPIAYRAILGTESLDLQYLALE